MIFRIDNIEKVRKKYRLDIMNTNVAIKCSTKFKKDFFKKCKKDGTTVTTVLREFMYQYMTKK